MKILLTVSFLLVTAAGVAASVQSTTARPTTAAPAADAFHPGREHALLQSRAGTWDAELTTTDPSGNEVRTKGTLTTTKHGECFTLDQYQGECMNMPFVGHGVNGYCTARKKYFAFWTDTMTSSPMTVYGDYDAQKRELVMTGECFGMSGKLEPCRTVTRFDGDDHTTFTFFGAGPDGREVQHLRIDYTRRR